MSIRTSILEPIEIQLADFRERFLQEAASNDRLKWLMMASGFVLYLAVVLFLSNQAENAERRHQASVIQLARIESQAGEIRWPERATEAQNLIARLEQRLWAGDTPGLAEAGFEQWIRRTFEENGVEVRRVQLTRSPATDDSVGFGLEGSTLIQRIRAKVISPLNEAALINFLNDAANHESWVVVEQLIVRPGRNARLEMDVATLYSVSRTGQ